MEPEKDDDDDDILILTVKGNLRHRIEKCGIEKTHTRLSDCQRRLCQIAREQQVGEDKLARPDWAGGAFVFAAQHHAPVIQERLEGWMRAQGRNFQSKYIFVSASLKDVLDTALDSPAPDGMNSKERLNWRRCGGIREEIRITTLKSVDEVARELDEALQRHAAATEHTAAPADASPSLGHTETEMLTAELVSDGCEGWAMVSEMRTDAKEDASASDGCDGWGASASDGGGIVRSHTGWAWDDKGGWTWSGWPVEPSPRCAWRWRP